MNKPVARENHSSCVASGSARTQTSQQLRCKRRIQRQLASKYHTFKELTKAGVILSHSIPAQMWHNTINYKELKELRIKHFH